MMKTQMRFWRKTIKYSLLFIQEGQFFALVLHSKAKVLPFSLFGFSGISLIVLGIVFNGVEQHRGSSSFSHS